MAGKSFRHIDQAAAALLDPGKPVISENLSVKA
jgi:hypothetical protein